MTQRVLSLTELAMALIACPSVTPSDGGCFDLLRNWLETLGFEVWVPVFTGDGGEPTSNLYARRGTTSPHLCFAGHVDVVPPGDAAQWRTPPFTPTVKDGLLFGRGAEDMKGALACMVAAVAGFVETHPNHSGSLSFLLTADEEGSAINGTKKLLAWLQERGEIPDFCLVGEPTNPEAMGEMAKIGRRGSLLCELKVHGKQGHVAYPERADNPITRLVAMLHRLKTTPMDAGNAFFPASNLEVTSIDVGNPVQNLIPAEARATFNIRFNSEWTGESLIGWVRAQCDAIGGAYTLQSRISGEAFISAPGVLSEELCRAVESVTGRTPQLSTTGGTSDARFIRDVCPVIEFGTTGNTPHQVNEAVAVADLETLCSVYSAFIRNMLPA